MDEIILLDNENLLAAAMEYAREKSDETAIILESFRANNIITLENSISIQRHIVWQSKDKLKLEPRFLLGALRAAKKNQIPFIFLHTHPNQTNLHFSELDKSFEQNMVTLAGQVEFTEPLVFLVASADSVIARYYWRGTEGKALIERTLEL